MTFDKLVATLGTCDNVKCIPVTHPDFLDWDKYFEKIYTNVRTGQVSVNHYFHFSKTNPGELKAKCVLSSAE